MYPPLEWVARPRSTSTLNLGGRGRASSNTKFMFTCEISSDNSTLFAGNFANILDMTLTFQGMRIGVSLRRARVHEPAVRAFDPFTQAAFSVVLRMCYQSACGWSPLKDVANKTTHFSGYPLAHALPTLLLSSVPRGFIWSAVVLNSESPPGCKNRSSPKKQSRQPIFFSRLISRENYLVDGNVFLEISF